MRLKSSQKQLEDTMTENTTLQGKLNTQNRSFVESVETAGVRESVELLKSNYERDEHKWNAEQLTMKAQIRELEQTIKVKNDEEALVQKRQEKNFENEM